MVCIDRIWDELEKYRIKSILSKFNLGLAIPGALAEIICQRLGLSLGVGAAIGTGFSISADFSPFSVNRGPSNPDFAYFAELVKTKKFITR